MPRSELNSGAAASGGNSPSDFGPHPALYVHVPFCGRKCDYCAFYSEAATSAIIARYLAALERELEMVSGEPRPPSSDAQQGHERSPHPPFGHPLPLRGGEGRGEGASEVHGNMRPSSVFFGGGTPSLLNIRQWGHIFATMERLRLLGAAEWTVECNPATITADKAKFLREHGVNRVSLGVQSLDETLLARLGRIHSRAQVFKAFDALRQAGFENINVDLMFALPGQTMETWRATLDEVIAMGSEHLSSYEVIYEEDAPLFEQLQAGRFAVDEDLACAMYDEWLTRAAAAGFRQYEVANLARHRGDGGPSGAFADPEIPDLACRHNVNYWRGGAFHGVGPSATSYIGGVRTKNWSNTTLYCEHLEQGRRPVESSEQLSPLARAGETAAFGLRMVDGWPFEGFQRVTGFDLRDGWREDIAKLVAQGWGRLTEDRFQLTSTGLRFADAAAEMFLRPV